MTSDYTLLFISFFVGFTLGLTSVGSAALMTPFLILLAGVRPVTAVGTDLVYAAITKVVGAGIHWRQGTVDMQVVRRLAAGSIPGGLLGAATISVLPHLSLQPDLLARRAVGASLILVTLIMLVSLIRGKETVEFCRLRDFLQRHGLQRFGLTVWGAIVGFCVGFTSLGSGTLIAAFLMVVYPMAPVRVVGTGVFHAAILLLVTGLVHSVEGNVEWTLVALLLAGAVPGVIAGSRLAVRLPTVWLRATLAVMLLLAGVKLI